MKLKDIFNIKNVSNFVEGNAKYFYDKLIGLPQHKREQVAYRLNICKNDCVPTGKCVKCGCPTEKKLHVDESCNTNRFPDMMNEEDWNKFKEENKIE